MNISSVAFNLKTIIQSLEMRVGILVYVMVLVLPEDCHPLFDFALDHYLFNLGHVQFRTCKRLGVHPICIFPQPSAPNNPKKFYIEFCYAVQAFWDA